MKRVMVLGCAGSGKSTFSRRLAAIVDSPCVHLDALYWNPGWSACETEEFRVRVAAALEGESWVSDGNYSTKTFDLRAPRADAIIWLNQPRLVCLTRVVTRWLTNIGRTRADLAAGCPEKLDWEFLTFVWSYGRRTRPRHEAFLRTFGVEERVTYLNGDREADEYLAMIAAQREARAR